MHASFEPCRYLDALEAIAHEAGRRILEIYSGDFAIASKEDGSPVTLADHAAHKIILERLTQLTPDIPVLSEESDEIEYAKRSQWNRFWLVDPLDGTKEFVGRNGEFTVNIALIENGMSMLGVVHVPVKDLTYSACHGGGAYKREAEKGRVSIHVQNFDKRRKPRVVASRSHATDAQREYLDRLGEYELVTMGSSLKFCLIAEGAADVYPRLGPTMEWDTAAAQCVVEVAGGCIVTLDGQPLRYNKPSLKNPWLIASGAGDHNWTQFLPLQK